MLNEAAIIDRLRAGLSLRPLTLIVRDEQPDRPPTKSDRAWRPDAIVTAHGPDMTADFDAEIKARSTPRAFLDAVRQLDAGHGERPPLLVVPYLREEQLDELERRGLSGVDLCGNGVIQMPGPVLVYRTGCPNRFPDRAGPRHVYRGATSLVARAFLCRSTYESLGDIREEVAARGGSVSLSTVSKALKRLCADVIVDREPDQIALRQPEALLRRLAESYREPKLVQAVTCRTETSLAELAAIVEAGGWVATGRTAVTRYAVMGHDRLPAFYTPKVDRLLRQWGKRVEKTTRFADFELRETNDPTVYFDSRRLDGVPHAPPTQAYVECMAGDKRERETAGEVARLILRDLGADAGGGRSNVD